MKIKRILSATLAAAMLLCCCALTACASKPTVPTAADSRSSREHTGIRTWAIFSSWRRSRGTTTCVGSRIIRFAEPAAAPSTPVQ